MAAPAITCTRRDKRVGEVEVAEDNGIHIEVVEDSRTDQVEVQP